MSGSCMVATNDMLAVEDLQFSYATAGRGQTLVLKRVSFSIEKPQIVALLGLSGAGKSTLLRCLNGSLVPDRGRISILGNDLHGSARSRKRCQRHLGTVYQNHALVQRQTARQNVLKAFVSNRAWIASFLPPGRDLQQRARIALDSVGLSSLAEERVDRLSGGQQQRVGVARAVANGPSLLLADEPVASLDPQTGRAVLDLIRNLQHRFGLGVVISFHQIDQAMALADRLIGIRAGAVLFDRPANAVDRAMINRLYT